MPRLPVIRSSIAILSAALLLAPIPAAANVEPMKAAPMTAKAINPALAAAVADPRRNEDRARDQWRKPAETLAYIRHRLQAAGGSSEIFEEEALSAIHELSGGLPRRINRLCDFALLVGYADNLDQVTPVQIEAVAEELMLAA